MQFATLLTSETWSLSPLSSLSHIIGRAKGCFCLSVQFPSFSCNFRQYVLLNNVLGGGSVGAILFVAIVVAFYCCNYCCCFCQCCCCWCCCHCSVVLFLVFFFFLFVWQKEESEWDGLLPSITGLLRPACTTPWILCPVSSTGKISNWCSTIPYSEGTFYCKNSNDNDLWQRWRPVSKRTVPKELSTKTYGYHYS